MENLLKYLPMLQYLYGVLERTSFSQETKKKLKIKRMRRVISFYNSFDIIRRLFLSGRNKLSWILK